MLPPVVSLWLSLGLLLGLSLSGSVCAFEYDFGPCSQLVLKNGRADLDAILYQCMDNIPATLFPPSYFADAEGVFHPTNVSVQIALNNIIKVDDLTSQFTMDFFFRIVWVDPRLVFNETVWTHLHPQSATEGIEISKYFQLQDQLQFWLPDIYFAQATDMQTLNTLIKLKPGGLMFWSRQMIVTFSNPQMPFNNFPNDEQNFTISLESFSYDSDFIHLGFIDAQAVDLLQDFQRGSSPLVQNNQIWKYQGNEFFVMTTQAPSPTNANRTFSTAFVNLKFARQSNGVIFRLALPVLIFLIIVGASFWSNESERIEVTLQIILVVAALYVIIGQSIPFVGYLTKMDHFIVSVFVILAVTISVHFFTTLLSRKASKYPLASFHRDLVVILFRGFWMPLSMGLFMGLFGQVHIAFLIILSIFAAGSFFFFAGKAKQIVRSYFLSLIRLKIKSDLVDLGALDEKTELPMKLSFSEKCALYIAQYLQSDGHIHVKELYIKYRPGLDASCGVTGTPADAPMPPAPVSPPAPHAHNTHTQGFAHDSRSARAHPHAHTQLRRRRDSGGSHASRLSDRSSSPRTPASVSAQHTHFHTANVTNASVSASAPLKKAPSLHSLDSLGSLSLTSHQSDPHAHTHTHTHTRAQTTVSGAPQSRPLPAIAMLTLPSTNRLPPSFYSRPTLGESSIIGNPTIDYGVLAEGSPGGHLSLQPPSRGEDIELPAFPGSMSCAASECDGTSNFGDAPPFPKIGHPSSLRTGSLAVSSSRASSDTASASTPRREDMYDTRATRGTTVGTGVGIASKSQSQSRSQQGGSRQGDLHLDIESAEFYAVQHGVDHDDLSDSADHDDFETLEHQNSLVMNPAQTEADTLLAFKRTIAKEMGAKFKRKEDEANFMAQSTYQRPPKPVKTKSFLLRR